MLRTALLIVLLLGVGAVVVQSESGLWIHDSDQAATAKRKNKRKQPELPPYTLRLEGTGNTNQLNSASVSCDPGDRATGGGFEEAGSPLTQIVDSSPFDSINSGDVADTWTVNYLNGSTGDSVMAVVVCTDRPPKHAD